MTAVGIETVVTRLTSESTQLRYRGTTAVKGPKKPFCTHTRWGWVGHVLVCMSSAGCTPRNEVTASTAQHASA